MKIYNLKREQFLPVTIEEAWSFFSSPKNLAKITPSHMNFKILYQSGGDKAYAGQIIRYKINVLPLLPVHWVTEITQVAEPNYFIDEQRFGPYALWHHQHRFESVKSGVRMIDEVNYAIPLGILGRLAHWLFVGNEVNRIFDHRFKTLETYFANKN
jgi:ligand-binding SRPBCC domain-containing protein